MDYFILNDEDNLENHRNIRIYFYSEFEAIRNSAQIRIFRFKFAEHKSAAPATYKYFLHNKSTLFRNKYDSHQPLLVGWQTKCNLVAVYLRSRHPP